MEWMKSLTGSGLSFLSAGYLLFLAGAALVRYWCPAKGRAAALLAVSWLFYCTWNPACLVFLLVTTISTFLAGRVLSGQESGPESNIQSGRKAGAGKEDAHLSAADPAGRKAVLAACLALNLFLLFACKYWTMFLPGLFSQTLLPVGISFYTLQALGYVIDCYRGNTGAEKSFISYALFVSFFPGITSGPIERGRNLLPQIRSMGRKSDCWENLRNGILILFWGYFLKLVLADRIAIVVNTVYTDPQRWKGSLVVLAVLLYSLQIYCDFAGYSAIAIGSARILGVRVMQNFTAPYLSASVGEFWRHWHISLSTWFRDYLYIPLGGNRKGLWRKNLNLLIVFAVSGLWHGAGLTFLFWGLLHGVYQVIDTLYAALPFSEAKKALRERPAARGQGKHPATDTFSGRLLRTVVTFLLVSFAWIFFRAESFGQAWQIIRCMGGITLWQLTDGSLLALGLDGPNWILLALGLLFLLVRDLCVRKGISLRREILRQELWLRWVLYIGVILLVLVCGIWGPGYDSATFIYSQF